ncbi:hypothetical protein D9611_012671 [Ephemerocybe angulata]|uniref:RanBD1 domain-containing protein n=1 Tax=Ephemerocybe angulata TaxID=980116 RepID=A0A8H5BAR8_9AGAR|nr:hypothetical protein D9611_012671 [Tulosesus angulatus]
MVEPQGSAQAQIKESMTTSPTPSPPLGNDQTDAELKLSRKREREVSIEPAGTPTTPQDVDSATRQRKDSSTRTPAKKNRRVLDSTLEEDDHNGTTRSRSNSVSPPLSVAVSPRQEMRIRQISQGVGDLHWKNMQQEPDDRDEEMFDEKAGLQPAGEGLQDAAIIDSDKDGGAGTVTDQTHDAIVVDETQVNAADTPPRTPDASLSQVVPTEVKALDVPTESTGAGHLAATSDASLRSDGESGTDKGLKRKFLERGTSQGPTEDLPTTSTEEKNTPSEAAQDAVKPHDTKNPSPTPESQPERTSPPSPKVPKLSGFMAYASTSSPFANVKGNAFSSSSKASALSPSSSAPQIGGSSSSSLPKRSGFEAFASSASPFASVSREKTPVIENQQPVLKRSGFDSFTGAGSPFSGVVRTKSPALGTAGAGVASSSSRLGRAKSPGPRRNNSFSSNPFGSYTSGAAHGFGSAAPSPAPKRARGDDTYAGGASFGTGKAGSSGVFGSVPTSVTATSVFGSKNETPNALRGKGEDAEDDDNEDGDEEQAPATFGERLRASGTGEEDGEGEEESNGQKIALEEQDVITGEEDEEIIMQVRGKLFALDGNNWKERGTGIMRLNVKRADGSSPRLVMRKDAVYTLLLNFPLFAGMRCQLAQDPRYVRFSVIEGGKTVHYNIKVSNAKIAQEFLEGVNSLIPST